MRDESYPYKLVHTWTARNKYEALHGTYRLLVSGERYDYELFLVQRQMTDELGDPYWQTVTAWSSDNHEGTKKAMTALANAVRELKGGED